MLTPYLRSQFVTKILTSATGEQFKVVLTSEPQEGFEDFDLAHYPGSFSPRTQKARKKEPATLRRPAQCARFYAVTSSWRMK